MSLRTYAVGLALALLACGTADVARAAGQPSEGAPRCWTLRKHGDAAGAKRCFVSLTREPDAELQAEGYWGLGQFAQANDAFRAAAAVAAAAAAPAAGDAQRATDAQARIRWGRMLHERFNDQDAQDLFKEALATKPASKALEAQAFLGLALVSADGFDAGATDWANKALQADPHLVEAQELLATLALEDSDAHTAAAHADAALNAAPDALQAMAVHAAIELFSGRPPDQWIARIAAVNPAYGEGDALIGQQFVLRARYAEGVDWYRKAIAADPTLWSARAQLGINLMRLGLDAEARSQLERCYQNGYRDEATVNSLRLLDSYRNFSFLKDGATILKLHTREADLLYPYFLAELKRSMATYEQKYQMKLSGPVQIEVYPDHEDFAVRTLGVPGLGALGVTFGNVVAMDSPSGRKPGEFHWASTLRHEMSHVYVLEATHHLVPRWFTEGLAVHEESQASPEWGDPMSPDIVIALRDRKLLPVAELNRGFVHPQFPGQVLVSYFQAGKICDYIQKRWGDAKLLEMIHAFSRITTTPEVIRQTLGMSPESFDQDFQRWIYDSTQEPVHFDEWREKFRELAKSAQAKQYDDVIAHGAEVIRLYPEYVGDPDAYEFVAEAYLAKGDKAAASRTLKSYVAAKGWRPDTLMRLAELQEDLGDPAAAAATLDRINSIDPLFSDALHRRLGALWLAQHNQAGAIREFQAVLAMHPLDEASAEFDLAQAYLAAGQKDKAEDAVLASLEAAPGYRPAQKLLLQLKAQ